MQKALQNKPVFDEAQFRGRIAGWERAGRIIVEWSTGTGPKVFAFPAGNRAAGVLMTDSTAEAVTNDERWADFLEHDYIPQIVAALDREGFTPQVNCVDLRPLQVQRARRRAIEAAAHAKAGSTAAH